MAEHTMQPDSAARPVVGRDHELSRITATISSGRPHDPAPVVLVVGEAGLGKTVLLDEVAGTLPAGTRVLRMSGDEAEADTDFTLVDQVIGDLTPRSPALAAAGGTTALDVGARLLRLTNALEPDQAVVLLLDDAQVADISSLHALTFFLRRVPGDRVAMVLATRPDGLPRLPPGLLRAAERTGGTIELGGLPLDAVGELAAAARVEPVPASIVARVHEVTGGHPLHARILLEQPDLSALADGGDLGQLPTLSSLVIDRLVTATPEARRLLDALAVFDRFMPIGLLGDIVGLADPIDAVDELIRSGVVITDGEGSSAAGLVALRHPLVRAAVYAALPLDRRIELHTAAAAVTPTAEALRHRVAAATGPDPDLVADLVRQAAQDADRGLRVPAAKHLAVAARLSAGPESDAHTLAAADHLLAMGRPLGELREAVEATPDSVARSAVLARAHMAEGGFSSAQVLLEDAWRRAAEEPDGGEAPTATRRMIAEHLAVVSIGLFDHDGVVRWGEEVLALGPNPMAESLVVHGLAMRGDVAEARRRVAALVDRTPEPDADARLAAGLIGLWSNQVDDAKRELGSVVSGSTAHSLVQALTARGHLAEAHLRAGNPREALDLAGVALDLLEDSDAVWLTPLPHGVSALARAVMGDLDEAREHAEIATAFARATGHVPARVWAEGAWLWIAEAEQDHPGAVAAGDRLLAAGVGAMAEGMCRWRAAYATSLAAVGRVDDARRTLEALDADAARNGDVTVASDAALSRGTVAVLRGDDEGAEAAFDAGLALDASSVLPLARAQLELAAGAFLRRRGERTAGANLLRTAASRLSAVGALPWLEVCERELAASGLQPVKRSAPDAMQQLSSQERVIARLVAEGRTNRQVADELYVSIKTVEHHLSSVYRKLGVRSRTQMADRLRTTPTD